MTIPSLAKIRESVSQGMARGLLIRTSDIAQFIVDACKPQRNQRELFESEAH